MRAHQELMDQSFVANVIKSESTPTSKIRQRSHGPDNETCQSWSMCLITLLAAAMVFISLATKLGWSQISMSETLLNVL